MKILQLISSAGFFGAENVVLELGIGLDSLNVRNTIGIFENSQNPHIEIAQRAGANSINIKLFPCNGRLDLRTVCEIKRFIEDNKIDVIHSHGSKTNVYGILVSKWLRKPVVTTCHGWIDNVIVPLPKSYFGRTIWKSYNKIDKLILPKFNKVVAVSENIEKELLRNNVERGKISIIFNGINIKKYHGYKKDVRNEFGISEKMKVIGVVARFTAEKGLFNLLKAARKVLEYSPSIIFLFVGDGPLRKDLEERCIALGIKEKVIFTGQRSDMPEIYSTMDIFVLPSFTEGLPLVLLEAMAAMRSIVATKVGAIPRVIEDRKEGMLIQPGNINELRDALLCLLKNDEYSKELSHNAFNRVVQEFSSQKMCSSYIEIYEEVLKKKIK